MRSDEIFYRLFKESPTTYFELIGAPAATAAGYKFTAEELKHAGLRLDGVFVPTHPGAPVHFVEAFTYATQHAYSNLFAKVFLWLETHNPVQDWRACVVFGSRSLAPRDTNPYRELLGGGRVQSVFLDELAEPAADQLGLGVLELIACPEAATLSKAKTWVQRVRAARQSIVNQRKLIELIEVVVLGRLPHLGRKELEHMLQLADVRESKVFAEGVEEGMQKGVAKGIEKGAQQALEQVALRMLAKGDSVAETAKLTGLPVAHVRRLKNRKTARN